jgi:phosphoribosylformylglycinamidine cyclo-ligase
MYSTFNMGIGFCIIVSRSKVDKLMQMFNKYKLKCYEIGCITKGTGTVSITSMGRKHLIVG